jgi:hypothetical protein
VPSSDGDRPFLFAPSVCSMHWKTLRRLAPDEKRDESNASVAPDSGLPVRRLALRNDAALARSTPARIRLLRKPAERGGTYRE